MTRTITSGTRSRPTPTGHLRARAGSMTARFSAAALVAVLTACASDTSPDQDSSASAGANPMAASPSAPAPSATTDNEAGTPITITAEGVTITASINDSDVSQDFLATLPATLPAFRNLDIEYISELDEPLTETGPFYTDVQPGDIVYYNPADSITVIYEETSSVPTLTKMGEITSDLSVFRDLPDDVDLRVEAA